VLAEKCDDGEDARYGIGQHFESRQAGSANGSGFCFGMPEKAEHDTVRGLVLDSYCMHIHQRLAVMSVSEPASCASTIYRFCRDEGCRSGQQSHHVRGYSVYVTYEYENQCCSHSGVSVQPNRPKMSA
jgi:hypothetical protein